jgi:hypothetical protein
MGKSKRVDIFAPSCSAVQLGKKDKPWMGVAGAFVEHQHLFIHNLLMKYVPHKYASSLADLHLCIKAKLCVFIKGY